jgi:hypothetical protein
MYERRHRIRVVPEEEILAAFTEAEASLPEDMKTQYPVSLIEEIQSSFPNQWLALLYINPQLTHARLIAHALERTDLEITLRSVQVQYPELEGIPVRFNGTSLFGREIAIG